MTHCCRNWPPTRVCPVLPDNSGSELSPGSSLAHQDERRPKGRLRLAWLALVDQREHGLAHGFCAAHGFIGGEPLTARVMSLTVASEFTSQYETSSARACA